MDIDINNEINCFITLASYSANVTIATHNQTLYSSLEQIFLSFEPIHEICKSLHLGKTTCYTVYYVKKIWWFLQFIHFKILCILYILGIKMHFNFHAQDVDLVTCCISAHTKSTNSAAKRSVWIN